jgi:3-hydroxyacyl-[acyl-carrier-protein] dehydratase
VRFILLDRILEVEKGQGGSFLKNVTQSEDFFADHFPDSPIMPGVLILEGFAQASQLLLSYTHGFSCYPELQRLSKVTFRHYVLPGDQLRFDLKIIAADQDGATVNAEASVDGRPAAVATLVFAFVPEGRDAEARTHCQRLKLLYDHLSSDRVGRAWESLADRF